jgi:hypothetical protein
VVWLVGLAFIRPGVVGLVTVIAVELAIIIFMSLFNPVMATIRLELTPAERASRTLTAWSISSSASIAVCSALAGLLAAATSTRIALATAGLLILLTPLLLPRLADEPAPSPAPVP